MTRFQASDRLLLALGWILVFLIVAPDRVWAGDGPALFDSRETRSVDLEPFPKWLGIIQRCSDEEALTALLPETFRAALAPAMHASFREKLRRVNDIVNRQRYRSDATNWGRRDHWSTPEEFLRRGGNCEDFAVSKYLALRYLKVPAEALRVVVVEDLNRGSMHAILAVYEAEIIWILDNQDPKMRRSSAITSYRAVYSINENFWWKHEPGAGE